MSEGELKKRIFNLSLITDDGSFKDVWMDGNTFFQVRDIIDEAKKDMSLGAHIISPPQLKPNKYICINLNDWKKWFARQFACSPHDKNRAFVLSPHGSLAKPK